MTRAAGHGGERALCIVIGAGAQGRVTLEAWRSSRPDARFVFLDDDAASQGSTILGAEVVGPVARVLELAAARGEAGPGGEGGEAVVALGNPVTRAALVAQLTAAGRVRWGRAIHVSAVMMPSATIGAGSVVFAGAIVNSAARIGAHVIVNTGVIVEHDCVIEDGANLSPGVRMGGRVHVGARAFVSTGVTLAPRVKVGAGAVIGAGAVVVQDIPDGMLAYGVPAKVVRPIDASFDWRRLL